MTGDLLAPPVPYDGVVNQWTQRHLRGLNELNSLVFLLYKYLRERELLYCRQQYYGCRLQYYCCRRRASDSSLESPQKAVTARIRMFCLKLGKIRSLSAHVISKVCRKIGRYYIPDRVRTCGRNHELQNCSAAPPTAAAFALL